jgi:hypothetical protein
MPHSNRPTSPVSSGPSTVRTLCSAFDDTTARRTPPSANWRKVSGTPSNNGIVEACSRIMLVKVFEASGNFQAGMPTWAIILRTL